MTTRMEMSEIRIGKFTISKEPSLWIAINDLDRDHQGEGGEFNEKELEKVIGKFYGDNF